MYNGIGLVTARGSGTNGFVQRNLSFIPTTKNKPHFRTEEELKQLDIDAHKEPNIEILEHARKRALEVKCLEMSEVLKEEGYENSEVENRVKHFREMLMEREQRAKDKLMANEGFSQTNSRETHAIAAAQQQKNARLKKAFGISEFFVEGSSLDPDRKAKEDAVRRLKQEEQETKRSQTRTYEWISTPSPERETSSSKKDKKKKSKRHRDRSSSRESKRKRKSKKSKRSR